jgi:hypothetical protein
VRRFALVLLVALLSASTAGVSSVLAPEPCGLDEQPAAPDGTCPPTCPTCGCCAQPAVPSVFVVTSSPDLPIRHVAPTPSHPPVTDPREILHVPKVRLVSFA